MFGLKIVNNKKLDAIAKEREYMATLMEREFTDRNELARAVYGMILQGMPLTSDSKLKEYVKQGYEGNPDAFSIITKLAGMFASVPEVAYKPGTDRGERVDMPDDIKKLLASTNYYQNFYEFKRHWATSLYVTGNAITYAARYPAGMNKDKITGDGLIVMPTQNIVIESSGWRNPIGKYTLDIDQSYKIDTDKVWHERFAPTLNYEEGANFMGTSPLKVAKNILITQNKGYEIASKMYSYGHPPGILAKELDEGDTGTTAEQESKFREKYRTKYQGPDNISIPIFTMGKLNYTKIGYDNMKELEIVNMSQHGLRVMCNILQVPAQMFNDSTASTYNNMNEAAKSIYTQRIIPDLYLFYEGLNNLLRPYDIELWPDLSQIDALQEDKERRSQWVSKMFNDGVITGDEYLVLMGEQATGLPEMQERYIGLNKIPLSQAGSDVTSISDSDKFYIERNLPNAM